ncbi:MAG: shikimate dehydrogenase [Desulfamplus sp.]|nr:shikimate dehydrogenase [Desulfamplus sp.]
MPEKCQTTSSPGRACSKISPGTHKISPDTHKISPGTHKISADTHRISTGIHKISTGTHLYALFGKPISHSMGPLVHNTLLDDLSIDGVYLAFEIDDIARGLDAVRTLGIKGISVTIPHKESILALLDEVDPMAMKIGAVNTVLNKNGRLLGFNTDCDGAVEPLKTVSRIENRNVLIFGSGGAARAVAFGIAREKGDLTIISRDPLKGKNLAEQTGGRHISFDQFYADPSESARADILINCTSIGMTPHVNGTPVRTDFLFKLIERRGPDKEYPLTVMDIVYNPLHTRLLSDAVQKGCRTVDGLSMFIHQGAAQFELFTGHRPSAVFMRQILESRLLMTDY